MNAPTVIGIQPAPLASTEHTRPWRALGQNVATASALYLALTPNAPRKAVAASLIVAGLLASYYRRPSTP